MGENSSIKNLYFGFTNLFSGPPVLQGSASSDLALPPQHPKQGLPDRLAFDTIDDGVENRGHHQVHVGNQSMHNVGQVPSKTVDHGRGNDWDVKDQDSEDVGDTGVEGSGALPGRGQPQDSVKNESIGQDDEQGVYAPSGNNHIEPIESVYGDVSTGSSHHIRVETERMG